MKQKLTLPVITIGPNFVALEQSANNEPKILIQDLVKKAKGGDSTAFGQIYDLYFERVYRFVYWRVNHREAAEDLVSETFIRAWDKLAGIASPDSFPAWVFQIARNLVIDYYRSRKENADLSLLENVLEYEDNIVDRSNFSFQQKAFLEVLKELTASEQQVLKLKFLEELSNQEIAAILNKTEGAVRVIQHRAIAELKRLIDQAHTDLTTLA